MTELEINRFIHEKMGFCWHNPLQPYHNDLCFTKDKNYTSSWSAYGPLLAWAKIQPWWKRFAYASPDSDWIRDTLLSPLNGSIAIVEFWRRNK